MKKRDPQRKGRRVTLEGGEIPILAVQGQLRFYPERATG